MQSIDPTIDRKSWQRVNPDTNKIQVYQHAITISTLPSEHEHLSMDVEFFLGYGGKFWVDINGHDIHCACMSCFKVACAKSGTNQLIQCSHAASTDGRCRAARHVGCFQVHPQAADIKRGHWYCASHMVSGYVAATPRTAGLSSRTRGSTMVNAVRTQMQPFRSIIPRLMLPSAILTTLSEVSVQFALEWLKIVEKHGARNSRYDLLTKGIEFLMQFTERMNIKQIWSTNQKDPARLPEHRLRVGPSTMVGLQGALVTVACPVNTKFPMPGHILGYTEYTWSPIAINTALVAPHLTITVQDEERKFVLVGSPTHAAAQTNHFATRLSNVVLSWESRAKSIELQASCDEPGVTGIVRLESYASLKATTDLCVRDELKLAYGDDCKKPVMSCEYCLLKNNIDLESKSVNAKETLTIEERSLWKKTGKFMKCTHRNCQRGYHAECHSVSFSIAMPKKGPLCELHRVNEKGASSPIASEGIGARERVSIGYTATPPPAASLSAAERLARRKSPSAPSADARSNAREVQRVSIGYTATPPPAASLSAAERQARRKSPARDDSLQSLSSSRRPNEQSDAEQLAVAMQRSLESYLHDIRSKGSRMPAGGWTLRQRIDSEKWAVAILKQSEPPPPAFSKLLSMTGDGNCMLRGIVYGCEKLGISDAIRAPYRQPNDSVSFSADIIRRDLATWMKRNESLFRHFLYGVQGYYIARMEDTRELLTVPMLADRFGDLKSRHWRIELCDLPQGSQNVRSQTQSTNRIDGNQLFDILPRIICAVYRIGIMLVQSSNFNIVPVPSTSVQHFHPTQSIQSGDSWTDVPCDADSLGTVYLVQNLDQDHYATPDYGAESNPISGSPAKGTRSATAALNAAPATTNPFAIGNRSNSHSGYMPSPLPPRHPGPGSRSSAAAFLHTAAAGAILPRTPSPAAAAPVAVLVRDDSIADHSQLVDYDFTTCDDAVFDSISPSSPGCSPPTSSTPLPTSSATKSLRSRFDASTVSTVGRNGMTHIGTLQRASEGLAVASTGAINDIRIDGSRNATAALAINKKTYVLVLDMAFVNSSFGEASFIRDEATLAALRDRERLLQLETMLGREYVDIISCNNTQTDEDCKPHKHYKGEWSTTRWVDGLTKAYSQLVGGCESIYFDYFRSPTFNGESYSSFFRCSFIKLIEAGIMTQRTELIVPNYVGQGINSDLVHVERELLKLKYRLIRTRLHQTGYPLFAVTEAMHDDDVIGGYNNTEELQGLALDAPFIRLKIERLSEPTRSRKRNSRHSASDSIDSDSSHSDSSHSSGGSSSSSKVDSSTDSSHAKKRRRVSKGRRSPADEVGEESEATVFDKLARSLGIRSWLRRAQTNEYKFAHTPLTNAQKHMLRLKVVKEIERDSSGTGTRKWFNPAINAGKKMHRLRRVQISRNTTVHRAQQSVRVSSDAASSVTHQHAAATQSSVCTCLHTHTHMLARAHTHACAC